MRNPEIKVFYGNKESLCTVETTISNAKWDNSTEAKTLSDLEISAGFGKIRIPSQDIESFLSPFYSMHPPDYTTEASWLSPDPSKTGEDIPGYLKQKPVIVLLDKDRNIRGIAASTYRNK
ncbi:MAG: hypothetical protein ABIF88_02170 [archaeon]